MSDNPDKNTTIAQVYGEFFGSVADTLRDARKKDPSIKLQDVKDWFAKNFVRKTNLRGYNSYVANYAHQEYQIDLFFINDLEDQDYKIGLLVVDIFTKFMTVVPLKNKMADHMLEGIKEAFSSMGKLPEMLYTDDEGAFHSKQAEEYYKDNQIKHLITRGHAPVAERAIRTIKDLIYKRIDASPGAKWYSADTLSKALVAYNYKMKHAATKMTPAQAKKPENIFEVKSQLEVNRVKKRKYPNIEVGDEVRIFTKKKNFQKERHPPWSQTKHKVLSIESSHGQDFYKVEGREKALMRHEILKT